jgi:leucyl/phenylalanyl-tRNA---protein transferase
LEQIPFNTDTLRQAYAQGFFPMPEPETNEIMWFHPDPRAVIPLDGFHVSRSLRKTMNNVPFDVTFNKDFMGIMNACSNRPDTWINDQFKKVYNQLHLEGDAHSVEVWFEGALVGGLYGVSIGGGFFAESKFHTKTDASKVALFHLIKKMNEQGMSLLEVQFMTDHLKTLGAIHISREQYISKLMVAVEFDGSFIDV